jgi:FecR protein
MRYRRCLTWGCLLLAAVLAPAGWAQSMISARSGALHYTEGEVRLGEIEVETKPGVLQELKEGQTLTTGEGRAELLLTPGAFLRVAEASEIRMVSSALTDTRIELVRGAILIEAADLMKDNAIRVQYGDASAQIRKPGIYRFDGEPQRLRVYDGEVLAARSGGETAGGPVKVKRGGELGQSMELAKFDPKIGTSFERWSRRRAGYIALANMSLARSMRDTGPRFEGRNWRYNPWFGMFTFVPVGSRMSPYGFRYWSPRSVPRHGYAAAGPWRNSGAGRPVRSSSGPVSVVSPGPAAGGEGGGHAARGPRGGGAGAGEGAQGPGHRGGGGRRGH